ncbi:hypothetical protein ACH5RR_024418 [Cinchona calisaya]|uniref:ABC-type xenobiotic transporter n=1 Tax=Cinchona calisaya TaxID=153742 RepID=A0ABD2YWL5_9GENT
MAYSKTLHGILLPTICEGEFDLGSSCIQRTLIDMFNLLIVFVFILVLFIGLMKKINVVLRRSDWITTAISICCALISISYFCAVLLNLSGKNGGLINGSSWLEYLVRGLIWITLCLSLLVHGSKWIKFLISTWWVVFFLLISVLNIEILVKTQKIQVLEVIAWLVSVLLLFCAFRTFNNGISHPNLEKSTLSEPLLVHKKNCNNLSQASFFSKLSFSWINPLLRIGNSKTLCLEDIPCLGIEDEAILAHEKFSHAWRSIHKGKDSINAKNLALRAIVRVYWKEMVLAAIYALLRVVSVVLSPLLLFAFVKYYNRETRHVDEGVVLVGSLVLVKVVECLSYRHFFFYARRIGMRMRSALMVAAYQKQLKLSSLGRQRHSTGEVVNYIAVDAYRMGEFPMWLHIGWSSGLQLFLAIIVLFAVVGLGVLPGLVPLLICGLLNVPFAKILQKCQSEFMKAQDQRLRAMSEILNSMKIIKLQSWEEKFKNLIESYRENEFKWLAESQYKKTYNTVLYWMCPTIVSSVIFFGCILFKSAPLDASTIFTVLAALRSMSEPVRLIPEALSNIIQVKVSFDRINYFLQEDEIKNEDTIRYPLGESDISIHIQAGNFCWNPDSTSLTIKNVNLKVRRGKKVAVCGPVGAGKSSILYAILGEIPKMSGNVKICGSIAYVSQASWIQSGTVRDNILFGKPMNKIKYDEAIRVSALDKDIESFDYGDLTEIGQRGINMSGGQKQRIQLARAVYSDADIYLLDDPFSAVDAHTAAALFNDCVMSALANKTVVLVTHQIEFLSEVDHILVMEGGQATQSGSYEELLTAGTAFEKLVDAHRKALTFSDSLTTENKDEPQRRNENDLEGTKQPYFNKENSGGEISIMPGAQLTEEEEKEIGDIGFKPFLDYIFVSKGLVHVVSNVLTQTGFVVLQAAASYWLAFAIQSPKISSVVIISVYSLISTLSAFFVYLRSLFAAILGLRASEAFFSGFTNSIFNAPMLFFDSTPVGRILTRASSDLSVLDFDIPFAYAFVMAAAIELVATIGIMASVTWQVLIVGISATVASKYVQGYYQASARELMRINGTTKAPIMNYASETALGVATIRAFNMSDRFFENYLKLVDTDAEVFLLSNAAMEWLVLRTEILQNLTLFTAALLLVLLPKGYVAPGLVGLSLSYAFALTNTQVFLSRWYSSLVNYIISVERIKQFMHITPEPPAIVEDRRPPSSWPPKGRIELVDLKIRYRPNAPIVLKGITCTFSEGTRVGVVGRTGSGKTTLISALFRLVDPFSGLIIVDGIDICSIGLKDLRLKLSIIPQEPTLFRGSIRTNLDPLGIYSDEDIWKALEKCQLKDTVSRLANLLDSSVSDEGENWSMGQRQLFCLGRVLLRRNRILVLDEATASIDSATDAILQKVIREEFSKCTVITVAHRVPTVVDSDMVMVLSFGKLVEYDEPWKLMETNSSFSKLVAEYWSSCRKNSLHKLDHYGY